MRQTLRGAPLVLALSALLAGCKGDADLGAFAPKPVTLNADKYRGEITSIDRLVFDEAPFQEEQRDELDKKLQELAGRVATASDSRFIAIEVLELERLASVTRSHPLDVPRTALQKQWMRIRNNLFEDRAWFARSSADLEAPAR